MAVSLLDYPFTTGTSLVNHKFLQLHSRSFGEKLSYGARIDGARIDGAGIECLFTAECAQRDGLSDGN